MRISFGVEPYHMSGRLMQYIHTLAAFEHISEIFGVWHRCLALNCASEIANHGAGGHNCPPLLSCSLSSSVVIPLLRLGAFIAFSWNLTDWQQTGQFRKQLNGSEEHQQTPSPSPAHICHILTFHFLYIAFRTIAPFSPLRLLLNSKSNYHRPLNSWLTNDIFSFEGHFLPVRVFCAVL